MPAYDYRCTKCGLDFEVNRSITDREPVSCASCGSDAKRVFSPVGVVFKGSGFHNTDYRTRPKEKESSPSGKDSPACTSQSSGCAGCAGADTGSGSTD
ncbi:MAG TPA: zinc ribbon domain-containing protein [Actinobacteria bacterium]|nr:zinc ribbon domain-containing protein [Actinomycetota bacterium]